MARAASSTTAGCTSRRPRRSNYGIDRTFRVLMDLLTVWFMKRFLTRPMHVFGFAGLLTLGAGLALGLWLVGEKLMLGADIGDRPLLLMAVLAILSGVQLFGFGLLAELQMRTYHESQGRPIYRVRDTLRGLEAGTAGMAAAGVAAGGVAAGGVAAGGPPR